jgi:hypothetical protein
MNAEGGWTLFGWAVILAVILCALAGCTGLLIEEFTEETRARRGPEATCPWPSRTPRVRQADGTWRCQVGARRDSTPTLADDPWAQEQVREFLNGRALP